MLFVIACNEFIVSNELINVILNFSILFYVSINIHRRNRTEYASESSLELPTMYKSVKVL